MEREDPQSVQRCYIHQGHVQRVGCAVCCRPICRRCIETSTVQGHCPVCAIEAQQTERTHGFLRKMLLLSFIGFGLLGMVMPISLGQTYSRQGERKRPVSNIDTRSMVAGTERTQRESVPLESKIIGGRRLAVHRVPSRNRATATSTQGRILNSIFDTNLHHLGSAFGGRGITLTYHGASTFGYYGTSTFGYYGGMGRGHEGTLGAGRYGSNSTVQGSGDIRLKQLLRPPPRAGEWGCQFPLRPTPSGRLSIEMFFDGEPVELVVDPAKAQSMIPRQLAVSIGLVIENAELVEPSSEHADILDTTEVEDIVLGGRVIGPYEVWVCDDCHGNLGFLGTQLMDLLHMSIDTERRVAFMAQCDHGADRL